MPASVRFGVQVWSSASGCTGELQTGRRVRCRPRGMMRSSAPYMDMNDGSNVMSIKQNVKGDTGLVAAMSDAGRFFPRLIALAAAAATVSAQAEPASLAGVATPARPAMAVDVGRAAVGSQAEAGSVVAAPAAREP